MNFILETRENIIKNNNTAQEDLIGILLDGKPSSTEVIINDSLHGNLDYSIVYKMDYKNVKSFELREKGEVVSISNLHSGLEKLVVSNQLLIELANLPKTLTYLDCQNNSIQELDVSHLNKLRVLKVSNNQLKELKNLPDSLEELYCENNNINILNLKDLLNLRVLHISNNKAIIVDNLPPSVVDFKSENNPYIEIQHANLHSSGQPDNTEEETRENEEKIDYIESIFDYYKLKRKYEENLYKKKKKTLESAPTKSIGKKRIAKIIPQCIQCKQPGGTIFYKKNETNYAVCGNKSSPCNLNIEIYNGKYYWLDEMLTNFGEEILTDLKTNIICQKMDNIFHFVNEKNAIKEFKRNMEEFTVINDETNELYVKNNQLYKDEIREELRTRKVQRIYELIASIKELITQYKKDGNTQLLRAAIEIQVNELNPEIHNLRRLRYEIMEVELTKAKKISGRTAGEEDDSEEKFVYNESVLFQRYASLQKMLHSMGKPSNVVKYKTA